MQHVYDYLIVGAGLAGEAAAQAIRGADDQGTIGMLGDEAHPPYDRPPLSKALWKDGKEDDIWRPIAKARATVQLGRRARTIDRAAHVVHDDAGDTWQYKKLLLATGGTPRTLPFGEGFIYLRTYDDYKRLRAAAKPGAPVETSIRNVAYALLSGADGWMFDGEDALGQVRTMSLDNQRNLKLAIAKIRKVVRWATEMVELQV